MGAFVPGTQGETVPSTLNSATCECHGPKLAECQPAGSEHHVLLDMATQPTGWPKKVPSTDTLGPDSTGQGSGEGPVLSSLAPSSSPCPLGPCLPWARSGQRSLKLWVVAQAHPGLRGSPSRPGPSLHGQSLGPSRYRTQSPTRRAATSLPARAVSTESWRRLPRGVPPAGAQSTGRGFPEDTLSGGFGGEGDNVRNTPEQGPSSFSLRRGRNASFTCLLHPCAEGASCDKGVGHVAGPQKGNCYLRCDRVRNSGLCCLPACPPGSELPGCAVPRAAFLCLPDARAAQETSLGAPELAPVGVQGRACS